MTLLDSFPHTIKHQRPSYTTGAHLGQSQSLTDLATGISAWIQNASAREIEEFGKMDEEITHKVFFTTDPGLRPGDLIEVTAADAGTGHVGNVYEFKADSPDRSAGLGVVFAAMFKVRNDLRVGSFANA